MFLQLFINAICAACVYMLVAFGFGLIYATARFFHFAHAVVFTSGAYFTYLLSVQVGLPLLASIPMAVALTVLLGCLLEFCIYRPLRHRGSSPLVLLLASFGIYIVLQNTISMAFGDDTKSLEIGVVEQGLLVFGARVTLVQVTIIVVSIALLATLWGFMRATRTGLAMRAVASDPGLARLTGIDSDRVILWAIAAGSGLAGIAGILVALDVNMTPTMGVNVLMMGIVAVIIGGIDSIPGVALGALLLGMAQHLGTWRIGSQWQDAIAFVILLAFLLFRPEGFMGKRVRKATV